MTHVVVDRQSSISDDHDARHSSAAAGERGEGRRKGSPIFFFEGRSATHLNPPPWPWSASQQNDERYDSPLVRGAEDAQDESLLREILRQ